MIGNTAAISCSVFLVACGSTKPEPRPAPPEKPVASDPVVAVPVPADVAIEKPVEKADQIPAACRGDALDLGRVFVDRACEAPKAPSVPPPEVRDANGNVVITAKPIPDEPLPAGIEVALAPKELTAGKEPVEAAIVLRNTTDAPVELRLPFFAPFDQPKGNADAAWLEFQVEQQVFLGNKRIDYSGVCETSHVLGLNGWDSRFVIEPRGTATFRFTIQTRAKKMVKCELVDAAPIAKGTYKLVANVQFLRRELPGKLKIR